MVAPMTRTTRLASNLSAVRSWADRALAWRRSSVVSAVFAVLRDHLEDDVVYRGGMPSPASVRSFDGVGGGCLRWKLMISIGLFADLNGSSPVSIS